MRKPKGNQTNHHLQSKHDNASPPNPFVRKGDNGKISSKNSNSLSSYRAPCNEDNIRTTFGDSIVTSALTLSNLPTNQVSNADTCKVRRKIISCAPNFFPLLSPGEERSTGEILHSKRCCVDIVNQTKERDSSCAVVRKITLWWSLEYSCENRHAKSSYGLEHVMGDSWSMFLN